MRHKKFLLVLVAITALSAFAQRGALTVPRNAGELATQAETIFRGHVVNARVEPLPGHNSLQTVVVTMRVDEALKGSPGGTYTFRQYIWDIRDRYDAAGYRKGQELLMMLNPPTRLGLTSPAGLDQGRFRIKRTTAGAVALNGTANYHLFARVTEMSQQRGLRFSPAVASTMARHQQGPVALDQLQEVIRQFARSK